MCEEVKKYDKVVPKGTVGIFVVVLFGTNPSLKRIVKIYRLDGY